MEGGARRRAHTGQPPPRRSGLRPRPAHRLRHSAPDNVSPLLSLQHTLRPTPMPAAMLHAQPAPPSPRAPSPPPNLSARRTCPAMGWTHTSRCATCATCQRAGASPRARDGRRRWTPRPQSPSPAPIVQPTLNPHPANLGLSSSRGMPLLMAPCLEQRARHPPTESLGATLRSPEGDGHKLRTFFPRPLPCRYPGTTPSLARPQARDPAALPPTPPS